MSWAHGDAPSLLALGCTDGILALLRYPSFSCAARHLAHERVSSDDASFRAKFPSLHLQSDIWSLCWAPSNSAVATCGEDQSVRVWKLKEGNEGMISVENVCILRGHTLAATAVDWQRVFVAADAAAGCVVRGEWREVLASASDDRTVRLYDAESSGSWRLLRVLSSDSVPGWHTLTYMQLERYAKRAATAGGGAGEVAAGAAAGGAAATAQNAASRLICVTENGFVVVFELLTGRCVHSFRTTGGSIEGVVWEASSGRIALTSSDTSVLVLQWQQGLSN
jgi:WD40 repeat protein